MTDRGGLYGDGHRPPAPFNGQFRKGFGAMVGAAYAAWSGENPEHSRAAGAAKYAELAAACRGLCPSVDELKGGGDG